MNPVLRSGRVSLHEIAAQVGVSTYRVLVHFPPHFSVPRDWIMEGSTAWVRVESLGGIADEFAARGDVDTAGRLRKFAATCLPPPRRVRGLEVAP